MFRLVFKPFWVKGVKGGDIVCGYNRNGKCLYYKNVECKDILTCEKRCNDEKV